MLLAMRKVHKTPKRRIEKQIFVTQLLIMLIQLGLSSKQRLAKWRYNVHERSLIDLLKYFG